MTDRAKAARDALRVFILAHQELQRLSEEIETVRAKLASTSRPARDVDIQYNRDPRAIEGLIATLSDLTAFYDARLVDVERMRLTMERRISQITGTPGMVLQKRYLQGKMLEDIAHDMEYSIRQIIRMHVTGLEQYAKLSFHVTDIRDTMAM